MRINILGKSAYDSSGFTNEGGILSGPLLLAGNPTNPLEASTKNYVDLAKNSISASNITTGILSINRLPSFNGDFTSTSGSNVFTLSESGVTAGTYTKVVVDTKGRVTFGSNLENSDIPNFNWNKITSGKPTTLAGYGITNGINPAGDNITGYLTLHSDPSTAYHLATKGYIDSLVGTGTNPLMPGDTIRRPSSVTPTGFLRCNGAQVSKTEYSALYNVIGDTYSVTGTSGSGQPWRQQYLFNTTQNTDITGWSMGTALPGKVGFSQAIVTKNRVYLLGGYNNTTYISTVYTAPINVDGTLGTWTTGTALPGTVSSSQAIVTKNRVYLLGGIINGSYGSTVYTAPINVDGTLGTWTTGTALPGTVSSSQAIVTKNRVYLLGGFNGSYRSTVYTAPINEDGTLGTWTTGTALPETVGNSHAIVTKSRVYLLCGNNGNWSSTVYTAPINEDGTLGTWTTGTALPETVGNSQAIVTKSRVYLLGGLINGPWSSTVYTAPINEDGTLGTWTTGTALPETVGNSQAIVTNSRVYLLGGYSNGGYSDTVYTAPFIDGLNDYSPYYDGSILPSDPNNFNLPDTTLIDTNGIYTFIKS